MPPCSRPPLPHKAAPPRLDKSRSTHFGRCCCNCVTSRGHLPLTSSLRFSEDPFFFIFHVSDDVNGTYVNGNGKKGSPDRFPLKRIHEYSSRKGDVWPPALYYVERERETLFLFRGIRSSFGRRAQDGGGALVFHMLLIFHSQGDRCRPGESGVWCTHTSSSQKCSQ